MTSADDQGRKRRTIRRLALCLITAVGALLAAVGLGAGANAQGVELDYLSSCLSQSVYDARMVGDYAYVLYADGLAVLDITNPGDPLQVSFLFLPGGGRGLEVNGSYVYVADGDDGLVIIDISNPAAPTVAGAYDTPGFAYDVHIYDGKAFVADAGEGLQIIDISEPTAPSLVGNYIAADSVHSVYAAGTYAYLAISEWFTPPEYGLGIVDISDPMHPTWVNGLAIPGGSQDIQVRGGVAYLSSNSELHTVDVSNPLSLTIEGSFPLGGGWYAKNGLWLEDTVVFATTLTELQAINVADPTNPELLGYSMARNTYNVHVEDSRAFVARLTYGYDLVDVSDPVNFAPLYSSGNFGSSVVGVKAVGDLVVALDGYRGSHLVDVSDPGAPDSLDSYVNSGFFSDSRRWIDLAVCDSTVILGGGDRIVQLEVTSSGEFDSVGAYECPSSIVALAANETYAFAVMGNTKLAVFELGALTSAGETAGRGAVVPAVLSGAKAPLGIPTDLALDGTTLYVTDRIVGLVLLDVAAPSNVPLINYFDDWALEEAAMAENVMVADGIAYVIVSIPGAGSRLVLLDVSDPENITKMSDCVVDPVTRPSPESNEMTLIGKMIAVADNRAGLVFIDVSDPLQATPIRTHHTPGAPRGLCRRDTALFVADYNSLISYSLSTGCCTGVVGDVNMSGEDNPTIGDVSLLIDALFISVDLSMLECLAEADVNQSGGADPQASDVTIGDLSLLIDLLFITVDLDLLPECP